MKGFFFLLCIALLAISAQAGDPWWLRTAYPTTFLPMCKSLGLFQWAMTGPGGECGQACAVDTHDMNGDGRIDLFDWAEIQVLIGLDAYAQHPNGTGMISACFVQLPPDGRGLPLGWFSEVKAASQRIQKLQVETLEIVEKPEYGQGI